MFVNIFQTKKKLTRHFVSLFNIHTEDAIVCAFRNHCWMCLQRCQNWWRLKNDIPETVFGFLSQMTKLTWIFGRCDSVDFSANRVSKICRFFVLFVKIWSNVAHLIQLTALPGITHLQSEILEKPNFGYLRYKKEIKEQIWRNCNFLAYLLNQILFLIRYTPGEESCAIPQAIDQDPYFRMTRVRATGFRCFNHKLSKRNIFLLEVQMNLDYLLHW